MVRSKEGEIIGLDISKAKECIDSIEKYIKENLIGFGFEDYEIQNIENIFTHIYVKKRKYYRQRRYMRGEVVYSYRILEVRIKFQNGDTKTLLFNIDKEPVIAETWLKISKLFQIYINLIDYVKILQGEDGFHDFLSPSSSSGKSVS